MSMATHPPSRRALWAVVIAVVALQVSGCLVKAPAHTASQPTVQAQDPRSVLVEVPDVSDRSLVAATAALGRLGLRVAGTTQESSQEIAEGRVVRTDPAAQEWVEAGSGVTLIVSSGAPRSQDQTSDEDEEAQDQGGQTDSEDQADPDSRPVPDLIGLPLGRALARLADRGFESRIRRIETAQPDGIVIEQAPESGRSVEAGSTITVVVSRSREPSTTSPTPSGPSPTPLPAISPSPSPSVSPS